MRSRWPAALWALACLGMTSPVISAGLTSGPAPADADSVTQSMTFEQLLEAYRRAVWVAYSATNALGTDTRGRTLAQDLDEWVMPNEVLEQLHTLSTKISGPLAAQQSATSPTLTKAFGLVQEQSRRLALINQYWGSKVDLDEQRQLWHYWLEQVSSDAASASSARMATLESEVAQEYSRQLDPDALGAELYTLRTAYDRERTELARLVSEQRAAAGAFMAVREPSTPCVSGSSNRGGPQPVVTVKGTLPNYSGGSGSDAAVADAQRQIRMLSTPPLASFYPDHARRVGFTGRVMLRLTVSASGCLERTEVLTSSGIAELDDEALKYAEYARYAPAEQAGRPITSTVLLPIKFSLDGPAGRPDQQFYEHLARGSELMSRNDFDGAIVELDQAVALKSTSSMALAQRGLAHVWKHELSLARLDLDAAASYDARNAVVPRARGLIFMQGFDYQSAIDAFSGALDLDPKSAVAWRLRAIAYMNSNSLDRALADAAEALRLQPQLFDLYEKRALMLRARHQPQQAAAEATTVTERTPTDARSFQVAGNIYEALGNEADAMRAFDRAVQVSPSDWTYLERAAHRERTDVIARRADIEGALKLNPQSLVPVRELAKVQADSGDASGALAQLSAALAARGSDLGLLLTRAIIRGQMHGESAAQQDIDLARSLANNPGALNNFCWALATANVALESALSACDAALRAAPLEPTFLDSRGFVLLRLGRYREAIEAYNAALQGRPLAAESLYGRALAERQLGQREAEADLKAALVLDATVADRFADFGMAP